MSKKEENTKYCFFFADPHQTRFSSSSKFVEPLSGKVISYLGTTLEPDSSSAPLADLLPADLCCAASMFRGSTKFVGPSKEVGLSKWSPFSSWDMFSTSPCSVPKIDSIVGSGLWIPIGLAMFMLARPCGSGDCCG